MEKLQWDYYTAALDHFSNYDVIGLSASGLKDYKLAWILQQNFGFDFILKKDWEIFSPIQKKKSKNKISLLPSLFDQISLLEEDSEKSDSDSDSDGTYYSVYEYKMDAYQNAIYLFTNKLQHRILIQEYPMVDYFLFVCKDYHLSASTMNQHLKSFSSISLSQIIELETITSLGLLLP